MEETVIWVGGLVIEVLAVATMVLIVLLRRSRRAQRQLLAQLASKEQPPVAAVEMPAETPAQTPDNPAAEIEPAAIEPVEIEAPVAQTVAQTVAQKIVETVAIATELIEATPIDTVQTAAPHISASSEFAQLREIVDNAGLEDSTERLQQRLDETNHSLQRLARDLQQDSAAAGTEHPEIASLQGNVQEMTSEVDSLQQSSAQLQRDLRDKTHAIEKTFAEKHETTERELHHAKKLRRDMTMLRDKLKNSEGDVQRLETEKEVLAAEYAALNSEYERIYTHSARKSSRSADG